MISKKRILLVLVGFILMNIFAGAGAIITGGSPDRVVFSVLYTVFGMSAYVGFLFLLNKLWKSSV